MKNLLRCLLSVCLLVCSISVYSQTKVQDLTNTTTPASTDILYVVINPSSTPADRKLTIDNLFKSRNGNQSVTAYASLAAAVSAIGSTQATIEIPATTTVSSTLTSPANIALSFTGTGIVSVSSGQTLTVNGSISAPVRQIFTGSGTVRFGQNISAAFPQWFGAKSDGSTNDFTAISAALGSLTVANGVVDFPPGVYMTGTKLQPASNVTLRGAGRKASIIKSTAGFNSNDPLISVASKSHVSIIDLGLDSTSTIVRAVHFSASSHCTIERCWTGTGFNWDIFIGEQSTYCQVINCVLQGTSGGFMNVEINGSSYNAVINSMLLNSSGNAVEIYHPGNAHPTWIPTGNKIIGCHIEGTTAGGIFPAGDYATVIEDNTIINCADSGILPNVSEDGTTKSIGGSIIGNKVLDCGGTSDSGIVLPSGALGWTVKGNFVKGSGNHGIDVFADFTEISGNFVYLNRGNGITIQGTYNSILGNRAINNSVAGAGSNYGIQIATASNMVSGNTASDNRGTKLQDYGLVVTGNDNDIGHNILTGNLSGTLFDAGSNNRQVHLSPSSAGSEVYAVDSASGATLSVANNATGSPFGSSTHFSGQLLVFDPSVSGALGVFAVGGGVALIGESLSGNFSTTAGSSSKINVYIDSGVVKIENKKGSTITFRVMAFRSHNSI